MLLLDYFKELTVHPKNAEELKGLILQLAVQGKLTAQWRKDNPDVEPALVLLERLKAEKVQLIKEKKIKKEKPLPTVEDEGLNQSIPDTWLFTRLGEIGDWGAGATPSRSRSDFYGGSINWFKSGELNNGVMDYNSKETINELAIQNSSLRLNKIGDVLIAMYGATIGKTGMLAVEGATNQAVCACTPFTCISNRYLHLLLKALKEVFIKQGEGGAQPNISRVKLRNQMFALPPLEEQKAIVAIVNQLFQEVEQLEALTKERVQLKADFVTSALQQLSQAEAQDTASQWAFLQEHFGTFFTEKGNVKKLRESILQLAVQGKLTKLWRQENKDLEPAATFLGRIKIEKSQLLKEKKIRKEKPIPQISEKDIPYELPEGWEWCRMLDFCYLITDGAHHTPKYVDSGVPFLSVKNLSKGGIDFLDTKFIEKETHQELIKRCNPEFEDILLTKIGTTGIAKVIDVKKDFSIFVSVALLKIAKEHIYPLFIEHCINSPLIKQQSSDGTEGVGNKNLVLRKIKAFIIPMPPIAEQKAIVEKVKALMALCDNLENEIETRTTIQEDWMKSCLREVFLPAEESKAGEGADGMKVGERETV